MLFILLGFFSRQMAILESEKLAFEVSEKAIIETRNFLTTAFNITRTFANSAKVLKKNQVDRSIFIDMIKESITNDSSFLSAWFMWEPNLYDSRDHEFANKPLYDSLGEYGYTFYWIHDSIKTEPNEPNDYFEPFYAVPKKLKKELITEPYYYNYTGSLEVFFETSVITPIIIDSVFNGVVAVDLDLRKLQRLHSSLKIYKSGFVSLISNQGIIISNPDTNAIGQNIKKFMDGQSLNGWQKQNSDSLIKDKSVSVFSGRKVYRIIKPIIIGDTNEKWYMLIEIPVKEINANSNQFLIYSFIILVIGIILMFYLIFNLREQRIYEKQLIESKNKAEESDRLKTAFLSNISHEIRTPMNGIVGFSQMVTDHNLSEERRDYYAQIIVESSNTLLSVVNDILDISRLEAGIVHLYTEKFNIAELLIEVLNTNQPKALAKNISFKIVNDSNSQPEVTGDKTKIYQVLNHLLSNAFKFTNEGFVNFGYRIEDTKLIFYVRDSGIGIAAEMHQKVFELFRQAELSFTRRYGGTGLGLTISQRFVKMMGGEIWVESEVCKGSTFYFSVPYLPGSIQS